MSNLFDDPILLTDARARLDKLAAYLEPPDQQALAVMVGRVDELEDENRLLRAKLQHFTGAGK